MRHCTGWIQAVVICIILLISSVSLNAQALLPNITVISRNGRNYLTWTSGYTAIKQIGVQRSRDSVFNYATIGHVSSPNKKVNEYVDARPMPGRNFYRLFILLKNNTYFFTNPASLSLQPSTLLGPRDGAPQAYSPSIFVYTNVDGNVSISLANARTKKYSIRFFDADNHFLFEVQDIQKPLLILDKSNFMQSGWYHYELLEDGKIKEKWKFYIADAVDK